MLSTFIDQLNEQHPESRLSLARPAAGIEDVQARLEEVCGAFVELTGCSGDLENDSRIAAFETELAESLDIEPEAVRGALDPRIPVAAAVAVLAAGMALAPDVADAAEGVDTAADIAAGGFDLMDAALTAGITIPISIALGWSFRRSFEEKHKEINREGARAFHTMRLAGALMVPGSTERAVEELRALREIDAAAGGE